MFVPHSAFCKWNEALHLTQPQIVDKVRFVHAGCGVNALSGLQNHANSIYCRNNVGLISVAHQAIWRLSSVSVSHLVVPLYTRNFSSCKPYSKLKTIRC
ncbi:hypothetical protein FEL34_20200 [Escherichia coli]|nr:hypothetical protein [Escherichia coli]EFN6912352.1 hypothetical protein [Escherichia coli O10]